MTTSCLINNFNYGQYVVEAVQSAVAQTDPFDEIIVVDDGSTDDSVKRLHERFSTDPRVSIVEQPNGGQLSAFNTGLARATGELICFLDADDLYECNYLERIKRLYRQHPEFDYVFTAARRFGEGISEAQSFGRDQDFGYSVIVTWWLKKWIGAATSCISMRRSLAERILPVPYLDDWKTRADDCLVFGASLAGGRKFYLAEPLVRYRVHDANHFAGNRPTRFQTYQRRLALNRLFDLIVRRNGLDPEQLSEFAHREFQTVERPSWRQLCEYSRIPFRGRVGWTRRLGIVASMAGYYFLGLQR
jgi:glycosyltransferase involved in cell wall biosynthesis